jgi:hypothetical protein
MKEGASFSIYLHSEKADFVENGVDCPQWTRVAAKRLMDEDRGRHQSKEYEKLGIEQKPHPGDY